MIRVVPVNPVLYFDPQCRSSPPPPDSLRGAPETMSEGVDLIDIYADEEFNQVSVDAASLGEKGKEGKRAQKGVRSY